MKKTPATQDDNRRRQSPQDAMLEYQKYLKDNGYDGTKAHPTIKAFFKFLRPKPKEKKEEQ